MEMVGGNSCGRARRLSMAISESGLIKKSMRNCEKKIEENNLWKWLAEIVVAGLEG